MQCLILLMVSTPMWSETLLYVGRKEQSRRLQKISKPTNNIKGGGGKCTLCGITGHNKRTCDLSTQGNGVGQVQQLKKLSTLIQILVWGRDHLPNQKHVFKPAMLLLIEISGRILPPLT
ncbi:hypothetical protein M0R45_005677 [Rubus argutus]|uniref:Uncharacterized protein n=1 Tax=Rubus argutus TaxID=59490 RepID=A0AAW1YNH4_RUBAR